MRCCLALIYFISITALCRGQQPGVPTPWKIFIDTAGKFTARYPPTWTNKIKEGNRVFFTSPAEKSSDLFFENINIHVTQNSQYGTQVKVRDLYPSIVEKLKPGFKDFIDESHRFFKWNTMDALEIVYTGIPNVADSQPIRIVQWFCFYKTRLYTVTFTADYKNDTFNEPALKIMRSITFK